MKVVQNMDR
jgi:hypothetical protein